MEIKEFDVVKTLVKKVDFGRKSIRKGTRGVVAGIYEDGSYAVNFGKIWSVLYLRDEIEFVNRKEE